MCDVCGIRSYFEVCPFRRCHVCELQVVHSFMLLARKDLPGHAIYGHCRNALELLESEEFQKKMESAKKSEVQFKEISSP